MVLAGVGLLVAVALGVPVGAVIYLMVDGGASTLPPASLIGAAGNTFVYSASAGVLATAAALPIALLSVRYPRRGYVSWSGRTCSSWPCPVW